jgi:hypothetical protein
LTDGLVNFTGDFVNDTVIKFSAGAIGSSDKITGRYQLLQQTSISAIIDPAKLSNLRSELDKLPQFLISKNRSSQTAGNCINNLITVSLFVRKSVHQIIEFSPNFYKE